MPKNRQETLRQRDPNGRTAPLLKMRNDAEEADGGASIAYLKANEPALVDLMTKVDELMVNPPRKS
jgi:hypothetical protein